MITRPMLAATRTPDLASIKFPTFVSPKIDGIRCLKVGGRALTRKFKLIPNDHIRTWIEENLPDGVDGELMVPGGFNATQSAVMSKEGYPAFEYRIFDMVEDPTVPFVTRFSRLVTWHNAVWKQKPGYRSLDNPVLIVPHDLIDSLEELIMAEELYVKWGWEGVMLRHPDSPYKMGRATEKEQYLLKVKRWADAEGVISGFEERMRNENEAEVSEVGLSKRSGKREGLVPAGTLGSLLVVPRPGGPFTSIQEMRVGTGEGMTQELRQEIWDNRDKFLGKMVTFKYQPSGMKEDGLPRFPIWKGFRHEDDV